MADGSIAAKRDRLLEENPDYCSASDVGKKLGVSRWAARYHKRFIKHKVIDGITLYERASVGLYAAAYQKNLHLISRLTLKGVDLQYFYRMCYWYARTQRDYAPPEIWDFARRIAGL